MEFLHPPAALQLDGNKAEQWRRWHQRWKNFALASGLTSKSPAVQAATFLHVLGDEGMDVYNTFKWDVEEDSDNLGKIIEQFERYCVQKKNVTFERHLFNTRIQQEGETVDNFVKALRILAKTCDYADLTEGLIKDRIVAGIISDNIRTRLLERTDLKLEEAIHVVKAAEASKIQAKSLAHTHVEEATSAIDVLQLGVSDRKRFSRDRQKNSSVQFTRENTRETEVPYRAYNKFENQAYQSEASAQYRNGFHSTRDAYFSRDFRQQENSRYRELSGSKGRCMKCGFWHEPRACRAFGATCFACNGRNHYSTMCRNKERRRQVETLEEGSESENSAEEERSLFIGQVQHAPKEGIEEWTETLYINGKGVEFKLDTGAQCNIIPKSIYDRISSKPLGKSKAHLKTYTKESLRPVGLAELVCFWKGTKYRLKFQIIEGNFAAIIGVKDCAKMRMIYRNVSVLQNETKTEQPNNHKKETNSIKHQFKDVFQGLGELPGTYKIKVDTTVRPVIHAPRRVPHAFKKKLKWSYKIWKERVS